MTEELKEQIHERVYNIKVPTLGFSRRDLFNIAMEYAEPREKRIAELEKENAELRENLKTAYRKGMRHMAKALKDYDRTDGFYTDYFEHSVDKVLQREQLGFEKYGTLADQLTKAKEIIKNLMEFAEMDDREYEKEYKEAEQFLSEVEK